MLHVDDDWYMVGDVAGLPKARNVRGPSGMIIGRVLMYPTKTRFNAEAFQRGRWLPVGEFDEFDRAVEAAVASIRSDLP